MARLEVRPKGRVDCVIVKILVLVTAFMGENPMHLKHTVSFATLVSGGLGDPKPQANHLRRQKGSWLIFQPQICRRGDTR